MPKPGPKAIYMIGDNEGRIPLGQGLGIPSTSLIRLTAVTQRADGSLKLPDTEAAKLGRITFNGTIVISCHSNLKELITFGGHNPTAAADGATFAQFLNAYFTAKAVTDQPITKVVVLACQIGRLGFLKACKDAIVQAGPKVTMFGVSYICNRVGGPSIDFKYYYYGHDNDAATNGAANTVRGKLPGGSRSLPVAFGGALSAESLDKACGTICDGPDKGKDKGVTRPLMVRV